MPVDLKTATTLAEGYLGQLCTESGYSLVLISSATMEREFGWVFFYRDSDPSQLLAGNAPFIVDRTDGSIHVTGTAYPIEQYLESYAQVGRTYPFAIPEYLVIVEKVEPGFSKLEFAKLIHTATRIPISDAKHCADQIFDGRRVVLTFHTAKEAQEFCATAQRAGALAKLEIRFH